jgi:hypothetical protein
MRITSTRPILVLAILACTFSGCAGPREATEQEHQVASFTRQLQQAGISVTRTGQADRDLLPVMGTTLRLDRAEIEVFEFHSAEDQERYAGELAEGLRKMDEHDNPWKGPVVAWGQGRLIVIYPGHDGGTILAISALLGDPFTYEEGALDEPYPPAVVKAIQYLAKRQAIEPAEIQVDSYREVEWRDSCLGLGAADEVCSQVTIPGWRVWLKLGDLIVEVHTDQSGSHVRMEEDRD